MNRTRFFLLGILTAVFIIAGQGSALAIDYGTWGDYKAFDNVGPNTLRTPVDVFGVGRPCLLIWDSYVEDNDVAVNGTYDTCDPSVADAGLTDRASITVYDSSNDMTCTAFMWTYILYGHFDPSQSDDTYDDYVADPYYMYPELGRRSDFELHSATTKIEDLASVYQGEYKDYVSAMSLSDSSSDQIADFPGAASRSGWHNGIERGVVTVWEDGSTVKYRVRLYSKTYSGLAMDYESIDATGSIPTTANVVTIQGLESSMCEDFRQNDWNQATRAWERRTGDDDHSFSFWYWNIGYSLMSHNIDDVAIAYAKDPSDWDIVDPEIDPSIGMDDDLDSDMPTDTPSAVGEYIGDTIEDFSDKLSALLSGLLWPLEEIGDIDGPVDP